MEPTTQPAPLSAAERQQVAERMATCPFVAAAVVSTALPVLNSADRPLASIERLIDLGNSGGGDLGTRVLKLFARGNHSRLLGPDAVGRFTPPGTFNLQFGGSQGAHPGHSGILLGDPAEIAGGRLDLSQLERLAGYADPAGRLSIDGVGDFIADNVRRDPDARPLPVLRVMRDLGHLVGEATEALVKGGETETTEAFGALTALFSEDPLMAAAGEWGLLFTFLRQSPNSRGRDIALADVRMMFVDKQLPEGWQQWRKNTRDWLFVTFKLAMDAVAAYHLRRD